MHVSCIGITYVFDCYCPYLGNWIKTGWLYLPLKSWKKTVVLRGWLEETKHVYITHILEMILTVFFFEKRRRFLEKLSVRLGLETKQGWATLRFLGVKDISEALNIKTDKNLEKELEKITQIWIESIIEKEIKSKDFLQ